ncbi:hypothetical protein V6N13_048477 [Hibiscus sabdariffa]
MRSWYCINLMPKFVFQKLGIGEAKPTIVMLQLAERLYIQPEGKIEDILVQVDKFISPADFLILDCEADEYAPMILERPFLATGRVLLDFEKGELVLRDTSQEYKEIYAKTKISTTTLDQSGHYKLNSLLHYIKKPIKFGRTRRLSIKRLRRIMPRQYLPGQQVLLFNSRLKLFPGKLKSRWSGPFKVTQAATHGAIMIKSLKDGHEFEANGQRLKPYMGAHNKRDKGVVVLRNIR